MEKDVSRWEDLGVLEDVAKSLVNLGLKSPTPIQEKAIPLALQYQDVIGAAETGSGKTLAYGVPLICHSLQRLSSTSTTEEKNTLALVLVPTRELAVQVKDHLVRVAVNSATVSIGLIVGGLAIAKQERTLKKRPTIIVATPGRLWKLIQEDSEGLELIHKVRHLVIDEADRMLERSHFEDLKSIVRYIVEKSEGSKRQTLLFSATLTFTHYDAAAPDELRQKLRALIDNLYMSKSTAVVDISPQQITVKTLVESKIACEGSEEKDLVLYYLLHEYRGKTIVFANAISEVRRLSGLLHDLFDSSPNSGTAKSTESKVTGRPVMVLHAKMRQRSRFKYLDRFRERPNGILVASDVAARGLDITGIENVIHYHVPNNVEQYVHRSGRTARLQKTGLSVLLVDPTIEAGRYWRMLSNLGRNASTDGDIANFPLDTKMMDQFRERVNIARDLQFAKVKIYAQEKEMAEDDLTKDSDDDSGGDDSDGADSDSDGHKSKKKKKAKKQDAKKSGKNLQMKTAEQKAAKFLKNRLVQLNKAPPRRLAFASSRYPTEFGGLGYLATSNPFLAKTAEDENRLAVNEMAKQKSKTQVTPQVRKRVRNDKLKAHRIAKAAEKRSKRKNKKMRLEKQFDMAD